MKSQKGISLISLTVYIIGLTIAVSVITVISSYFTKNVDITLKDINPLTEYTKFTGFFSEEVNTENIAVLECGVDYIVFNNGVQYSFIAENKGLYRNKVKICRNVTNCGFMYDEYEKKVTVSLRINNGEIKEIIYKLKN